MPRLSGILAGAACTVVFATTAMTSIGQANTVAMASAANCATAGKLRGDAGRGAAIHRERCAGCHGFDGKAQVIVMHMDTTPHDQTDADYMKKLPDEFLYLAICRGGGAVGRSVVMPGWGEELTDQDIRDLVAWVRTFSGT